MELTKRQYEIIRHIPRKGYKSASQLSEEILVSEKTIRNEIAVINALFEAPPLIESHKSKGYCLNLDNQNYNFIFSEKYQYNDDSFQRQMEILRILLRNQEVSVMELCDALYIGEKRLRYDIHRINEVIKERHAEITVLWKDATLKIVGGGGEQDVRKILSYILMNAIREFNFSVENYQPYFTSVDIETVKTCVVSFFRENRLTIRDLDLFSLVLHVCIALERTCDGNPIRCPLKERTQDRYRVKELLERLAAFHHISLSEDEQNYMLLLFYARLPHSGIDAICENRFEDFICSCLSEVENQFHIDLRGDRELIKNLSYHLYMLCERAKKHSFLKNPMTEELKIQFPIAFDMGVLMGHLLGEILHVQPDENEIGYLTLHLLGAIERMDSVHKIKVAIVDPHGEVSARLIASRLLKSLGNKIEIVGYYSLFEIDHIRREEVDLIITTAVIIKDLGIKVENCSLAVTSLDVQRIEVRIRELETKAEEHIKTDAPLFFKELFYPQMDFKEKEEVISFLCTKLYEQGFCQADYFQAVMERERIAPTSFGSCFAIPHPIRRIALKDGLAVCSLKNSIYWNGHKVRLVLLFSATENEAIFDLVYERIVVLLNHHTKVKKLSRIEDFDTFVKQFYEAQ